MTSSLSSFTILTRSSLIEKLLASSTARISVKPIDNNDENDRNNQQEDDVQEPPLILQISSSSSSSSFPACALLRTDFSNSKNNYNDSNSQQQQQQQPCHHHQLVVPDYDLHEHDEVSSRIKNIDDIPHRVVADDEGRCIVVAETVQELFEFVEDLLNEGEYCSSRQDCSDSNNVDEEKDLATEHDHSRHNNILFTHKERISLLENDNTTNKESKLQREDHHVRQDGAENDDDLLRRRKELVQRINNEITESAQEVLKALPVSRLAQIYDDVESRREKMQQTKSTGSKDVKSVVIPISSSCSSNSDQGGEHDALMKVTFSVV